MKERFERLGAARALFIWPRGVARSLAFLFCATARPLWGIISFPWPSRARLGNLKGIIVGRKKIRAFDGRREGGGRGAASEATIPSAFAGVSLFVALG